MEQTAYSIYAKNLRRKIMGLDLRFERFETMIRNNLLHESYYTVQLLFMSQNARNLVD